MIINIDENSGFCWGVVRAIEYAEKELEETGKLYSLGEIIHNPIEIDRLNKLGLSTINIENMNCLDDAKVLIRAHGEPPSTFTIAKKNNIKIIDATCPIVKKVQERVRFFYNKGYQVIIFGKKEHAEVIGLNGFCENNGVVIRTEEEAKTIELKEKNVIFSQTTMDKTQFREMVRILTERIKNSDKKIEALLVKDTICTSVSDREKNLREFAKNNDVIIFVSGKNSSNGKVLYNICESTNQNSYFIERSEEINLDWFQEKNTVGITGATSTPKWVLEQVKNDITLKLDYKIVNSHIN